MLNNECLLKDLNVDDWFNTGSFSSLNKILFKGEQIVVYVSMWGKEFTDSLDKEVVQCLPPDKNHKYLYQIISSQNPDIPSCNFKEPIIYE